MNAVLVLTLVCALAYVTSATTIDCILVKCKGCAPNEVAVYPQGQCCPKCTPRKKVKACPDVTSMFGHCAELCSSEDDCKGNELSCSNGCGHQCMAFVMTDLTNVTCTYNGKTYNEGDSFPTADGCNTCTCSSTGLVACTLLACAPATP